MHLCIDILADDMFLIGIVLKVLDVYASKDGLNINPYASV